MSAVASTSAPSTSAAANPATAAPVTSSTATTSASNADAALDAAIDAAISGGGPDAVRSAQAKAMATEPTAQSDQSASAGEAKNLTELFANLPAADIQALKRFGIDPSKPIDKASFLANLRDRAAQQDRLGSELDRMKKGAAKPPEAKPDAAKPPDTPAAGAVEGQARPASATTAMDIQKILGPLNDAFKEADLDKVSELLPGVLDKLVDARMATEVDKRVAEAIAPIKQQSERHQQFLRDQQAKRIVKEAEGAWDATELPENIKSDPAKKQQAFAKMVTLLRAERMDPNFDPANYSPKQALDDAIRVLNYQNPEATVRKKMADAQRSALLGAPDRGNAPSSGQKPTKDQLEDAAIEAAIAGLGPNAVAKAYQGVT